MKINALLLPSDPILSLLHGESGLRTITSTDPELSNLVNIMYQQFKEMHMFEILGGLFFITLFVQALRFYLNMFGDIHQKTSERSSTSKDLPKETKSKKHPHVTKSDDGLGYWVKGYGDDVSYVPLTALYPEGTDMDEVEKLKIREPK